jgi:prephenate dehydrogenase
LALEADVIDEGVSTEGVSFQDLDLLVYCTPLNATLALIPAHRELLGQDTVVTDVVSLKVPVMEVVRGVGLGGAFVGSHPMCGGEGSGFRASRAGIFGGARIWLVAGEASASSEERVRNFWVSLGGNVAPIGPGDHDRLMALASHLPQLTSNALAAVLASFGVRRTDLGPGGRDMTRLAGSSPEMWMDLLEHAPDTLSEAVSVLAERLGDLREQLDSGQIETIRKLLRRTRAWTEGGEWS